MKDILSEEFFKINGRPDVIITDPPRAGMHEDVVRSILQASPSKIVYVSCNAATQARDILLLSVSYNVVRVQPVDMFPHTHHVENVSSSNQKRTGGVVNDSTGINKISLYLLSVQNSYIDVCK